MATPREQAGAVIHLSPWQRRWFDDSARVVVVRAHRQSGKDFAAAAKAVDGAIRRRDAWFIVSITQRQADATFDKARQIADAFKAVAKRRGEIRLSERQFSEYDAEIDEHFRCTARTLHLPGGGSVTALPGRDPDTLAGLTGNVIFTEFGLFPKGGYDHWRVVFPLCTRGFSIIVISTSRGKNTRFFELCQDAATYSVHVQTILDSVREGFVLQDNKGEPTDIETFRKLYGDEAGWRREYLCEFSGDLEALVSWALLLEAGAAPAPVPFRILRVTRGAGWDPTFFDAFKSLDGRLEIGWDVARHAHFSALAVNLYQPRFAGQRHLAALVLMHECEFDFQRAVVKAAMDSRPANVGCGDATGLGMDSNETLAKAYPGRWEPFTFTARSKGDIGSLLRTGFGDHAQTIPPVNGETKFVGTDVYAIQTEPPAGDAKRLVLSETPNPLLADSHCDVAYALGLARHGARISPAIGHMWTA